MPDSCDKRCANTCMTTGSYTTVWQAFTKCIVPQCHCEQVTTVGYGMLSMHKKHEDSDEEEDNRKETQQPFVRKGEKIGRNNPCPCGSGKKYKQCHGKLK